MSITITMFCAFAAIAGAPSGPGLQYTVSIPEPHTHVFQVKVTITFYTAGESLTLSMPVWTPGSYLIREFPRHVYDFKASSIAKDVELKWRKLDKNTWWIDGSGDVEITYKVYAREPGIRWSFVNADGGHILGSSLLMYVEELVGVNIPVVRFELPESWDIEGGVDHYRDYPFVFRFDSFHELFDTPMLIGNFEKTTFEVRGIKHVIAIFGPAKVDFDNLQAEIMKIVEVCADFFDGLPYEKYAYIILTVCGGGAIEHANGTSIGLSDWDLTDKQHLRRLMSVVAHEYFHAWNVKRIRPPEFKKYDYGEENYTDTLWWYEGVTSYYTPRILIAAGLKDKQGYIRELASQISEYRSTPGRMFQSAAEGSFDAWIKAYRPNENTDNTQISYYTKGSIIGLLLDLEIAGRTTGERGLDDVIHLMWTRTLHNNAAFGTEDIRAACEEVVGGSFQEIFQKYVYGTKEVPFEDYLRMAGYELEVDNWRTERKNRSGYLGVRVKDSDGRLTISHVVRGSPAWRDGLNYGDEILAVNGFRVVDGRLLDRRLDTLKPFEKADFLVSRLSEIRMITVTLGEYPIEDYKITEIKEPTPKQTAVRKKWLSFFGKSE